MDRELELVAEFWECLDNGRLDAALAVIGEQARFRPLAGGDVLEGRAGLKAYVLGLRAAGGDFSGHAYDVRRCGENVVVRGVVRYSAPGRFSETQGQWVHRVRDGALVECTGVSAV